MNIRIPAALKIVTPIFLLLWLVVFSGGVHAATDPAGLMDTVLARYSATATTWSAVITARATWLFWTLALISMVWTFGMLALRKADLAEFFAEFFRFTVFTGFFWWLLTNGPRFAVDIMDGLRSVAGAASGTGPLLTPSGIVDIGFDIFSQVLSKSSVWAPMDSAVGIVLSLGILICLALVGVNMLLLLVSGWLLAYAGVFFLGFGGSRWTSDMAITYYKTVLNIAAQLFTMVLLVGIGKSFVDQFYASMDAGLNHNDMAVMLIVAIILLALVNKVPGLIGSLATGGSQTMGGGFGAGAAMSAAAMAGAAIASGGAAIATGTASMAGGAQAIMSAASQASQNVASGSDIVSRMAGGLGNAMGGGGSSSGSVGDSPLAAAMDGAGGGSPSGSSTFGSQGGGGRGGGPKGGIGRTVADTAANLASGVWEVGKEKAKSRFSETLGGKVASAIQAQGAKRTVPDLDNSLSGSNEKTVDAEAEVAAFRDR